VETAPDGFYRFKYLTKGNYRVFAYSTLASGEKVAVEQQVKVGSGTTTAGNIYVHTGKAYGTSMVRGQVKIKYWSTDDRAYVDENSYPPAIWDRIPKYAGDIRVYIRRAGEDFPFNDVRTGENGIFIFQKLQPGEYEIYTYSADGYILEQTNEKIDVPVKTTITVGETGKMYDISESLEIIDTL